MEPECSLPLPTIGSYPEPAESSSHPHPISLSTILILYSHLRVSLKWPLVIRCSD